MVKISSLPAGTGRLCKNDVLGLEDGLSGYECARCIFSGHDRDVPAFEFEVDVVVREIL